MPRHSSAHQASRSNLAFASRTSTVTVKPTAVGRTVEPVHTFHRRRSAPRPEPDSARTTLLVRSCQDCRPDHLRLDSALMTQLRHPPEKMMQRSSRNDIEYGGWPSSGSTSALNVACAFVLVFLRERFSRRPYVASHPPCQPQTRKAQGEIMSSCIHRAPVVGRAMRVTAILSVALAVAMPAAHAAELQVPVSVAVRGPVAKVAAAFEKESGHTVKMTIPPRGISWLPYKPAGMPTSSFSPTVGWLRSKARALLGVIACRSPRRASVWQRVAGTSP
jgi:hypothetical protein